MSDGEEWEAVMSVAMSILSGYGNMGLCADPAAAMRMWERCNERSPQFLSDYEMHTLREVTGNRRRGIERAERARAARSPDRSPMTYDLLEHSVRGLLNGTVRLRNVEHPEHLLEDIDYYSSYVPAGGVWAIPDSDLDRVRRALVSEAQRRLPQPAPATAPRTEPSPVAERTGRWSRQDAASQAYDILQGNIPVQGVPDPERLLDAVEHYSEMSRSGSWPFTPEETARVIQALGGEVRRRERRRMEDENRGYVIGPEPDTMFPVSPDWQITPQIRIERV